MAGWRLHLLLATALLGSALPLLIALAAVLLIDGIIFVANSGALALAMTAALWLAWTAVIGVLATRAWRGHADALVRLAHEGGTGPAAGTSESIERTGPGERLVASLEERDRQVRALALFAHQAAGAGTAGEVAWHVVSAARSVTGNATWSLAVLESEDPDVLAPGDYGASTPDDPARPAPIGDLHRWAAVAGGRDGEETAVRLIDGPWGAFLVADVASTATLRAVLMSPWEGRPRPTAAEQHLCGLVAVQAATALEHAVLHARGRRQAERLRQLAAVQSDFLRGVTHDLQTPLTAVRALAAELIASGDLEPWQVEDLEAIEHQAERLGRMVAQLLIAARLEGGAVVPRQEVLRVDPIVERVWRALRAPRELRLDSRPHLAVADPDRLEQVLWALLDNAIKYSPEGTPIEVRLGLVDGPGGVSCAIAVTDSGIGMDETTSARAFDQFYRADAARAAAPDGSGIGLYAARGLVRAMGGDIGIESRAGVGTTLTVRLPGEHPRADEESDTRTSTRGQDHRTGRRRDRRANPARSPASPRR